MSEESRDQEGSEGRPLRPEELDILRAMLRDTQPERFEEQLANARVLNMKDGARASFKFADAQYRQIYGKEIAVAHYVDVDGVFVILSVNLDTHGRLFELDVWKVDDTPLLRYPKPHDLAIKGADGFEMFGVEAPA